MSEESLIKISSAPPMQKIIEPNEEHGENGDNSSISIQQVDTTDFRISTLNGRPENEPTVGVNPNNPSSIIASSHAYTLANGFPQFGLYRSTNGGASFTTSFLPVPAGFRNTSDPIIDADLNNRWLLAGIAVQPVSATLDRASIIVYRSVDDGANFSPAINVSGINNNFFDDKEYLAFDKTPTSPFVGNAYISYTRFTNVPDGTNTSQILLQRSVDGGLNWTPVPIPISAVIAGEPTPFVQGSNVQVGPNGEVYVAWIEGDFTNATYRIRRSDNGGVTFGPTVDVSAIVRVPDPLTPKVSAWSFRVPTFAFLAVDRSECFGTENFARVYAVWQAYHTGNAHIYLSFSNNGGANWSAPIRVDNSPENSQNFFPFVAVSPCSGTVTVIYYTNRESSTLLDVYLAVSTNGGTSFTNSRITDVSFNPNADTTFGNPSTFIGDYIYSAFIPPALPEPEKLISVWTDTRSNNSQDIFGNISDLERIPTIMCPANVTQDNDPGVCGAVVNFPTPTASTSCPGVQVICSPASGSSFPVGKTTVTCTATDICGGTAECSFTVTVNDVEPPTIICSGNITQDNDPGVCGAKVNYPPPTVNDNCPGATFVCSPPSGSLFPVGTTKVTCTATDVAGNTSAPCSFTVTVNDTEPPVINCPPDLTVCNDRCSNGAIVHFDPIVSDNCPGVTAVCTPASGSFFPPCTTTVICKATDASGNTSICSFRVKVIVDPCRFCSKCRCQR
ncbi:HYR domain-containing protein [Bacillus cihuensis]|uniref:HYR domain-containing protein n=1 Tax=Bacillus cihuensis TaxID=1208599 RepID=UPI000416CED8|nr:HYR domain-containing protein [Bacillus cihuensis]